MLHLHKMMLRNIWHLHSCLSQNQTEQRMEKMPGFEKRFEFSE